MDTTRVARCGWACEVFCDDVDHGRSRGRAEYSAAPLRAGRRSGRPWLRTAQLNVVGWAALLGGCLAAAALGVAVGAAVAGSTGLPGWSGAVLAVVPLGAVVYADRRRWAAMETSFGWGGSMQEVSAIVSDLAAQGVVCGIETAQTAQGWGEPAHADLADAVGPTASLRYRNRDAGKVRATLRRHGIQPFPPW